MLMMKKILNSQDYREALREYSEMRWEEVKKMREEEKLTFEEIGRRLGVTRQRAEQIYKSKKRK